LDVETNEELGKLVQEKRRRSVGQITAIILRIYNSISSVYLYICIFYIFKFQKEVFVGTAGQGLERRNKSIDGGGGGGRKHLNKRKIIGGSTSYRGLPTM
jgi:hypothetical protein